jgi:UDP-N-acetylglucosamine:LPS N-acetylglucosamine transferase
MAEACANSLRGRGWTSRILDSMRMMGDTAGGLGEGVFRALLAMPGVYDAFHFGQLRSGGRLARLAEQASCRYLVPALRAELERTPAQLLVSVFATGAAAADRVKRDHPGLITTVFCTDVCPHRLWVHPTTDLYLVTSHTAKCYVRRFAPRAAVAVVPAPVRPQFYCPPLQAEARESLGIPPDARTVLLMGGSWGLGPLTELATSLARAGVHVLAVAGRNEVLARSLRTAARTQPLIVPFGFTDAIPTLMSAADLVVTSAGDTCSEARVIGRHMLLLDVVPGHGRDNLQQELSLGGADIASPAPEPLRQSVLACLDRIAPATSRIAHGPEEWERAFGSALARIGLAAREPLLGS